MLVATVIILPFLFFLGALPPRFLHPSPGLDRHRSMWTDLPVERESVGMRRLQAGRQAGRQGGTAHHSTGSE
jgi:hypothetical protein